MASEVPMFPQTPSSLSFRILSHAGLLVQGAGKNLVFDPWLVGSSYWRSWWNYPPVPRDLVESLRPDFICLTHIHWDHFHGPSLRKFPRETPILIPRIPFLRMRKDLREMGFANIIELRHGRSLELAPGLKITSYQFHVCNDSAAVVECGGTVLFNANDARITDGPLEQMLARHPRIDFAFRGLGRADARTCFDFMDAPMRARDHAGPQLRGFAEFARKVGARHTIPFTGNHCHLHRETFHLNHAVITPHQVEAHCRAENPEGPEDSDGSDGPDVSKERKVSKVTAMLAGDSWSRETGFDLAAAPTHVERERSLREYAEAQAPALEKFYALEGRTETTLAQAEGYFLEFIAALPASVRRMFRGRQVTWVLTGRTQSRFWVDIDRGLVREVAGITDEDHPLQIYTSAYIFRRCMAQNLFLHLALSKRVLFRCRRADAKYLHFLITLFNLYESGMLPTWKLLSPRYLLCWLPRWREAAGYAARLARVLLARPLPLGEYLRTERPTPFTRFSPGTANTRIYRPKTAAIAVPGGSQL